MLSQVVWQMCAWLIQEAADPLKIAVRLITGVAPRIVAEAAG
jgi:hypothetical protein